MCVCGLVVRGAVAAPRQVLPNVVPPKPPPTYAHLLPLEEVVLGLLDHGADQVQPLRHAPRLPVVLIEGLGVDQG